LESAIASGISVGYFQIPDLLVLSGIMLLDKDINQAIEFYKQALIALGASNYDESAIVE
jgi:hypothetical protein